MPNNKNAGAWRRIQEKSHEADVDGRPGARRRRTGTRCRSSRAGAPPRAPATYVPTTAPVYNWGGFYVGLNGGWGFRTTSWTAPGLPPTGNFNANEFLIGGTAGFNYQMGQFVLGVEGDGDWSNLKGNTSPTACFPCTTQSKWLATVRGRAGYAFDRVLLFGTAGGAFADVQAADGVLPFSSSTAAGWTAGAGIEYGITDYLTAKIEYLYVGLSNANCPATSCGGSVNTTVKLNENVIRAGLNYKFGGF